MARRSIAGRVGGLIVSSATGMLLGFAGSVGRRYLVQLTQGIGRNWDEQLRREHRAVGKMLDELIRTGTGASPLLISRIKRDLTRHGLEEENAVYPAMAEALGRDRAAKMYEDHAAIKTALHALSSCSRSDPRLPMLAAELKRLVTVHIGSEERLLAEMKQKLTPKANTDLTAEAAREAASLA